MSGSAAPSNAQTKAQQIQAQNRAMRQWCFANGLNMKQPIYTQSVAGNPAGQVLAIPLRAVGLLKRLTVEVSMTLVQSAAETLTRTALGPANIFSNIQFLDLNNLVRINCTGWYLTLLASMRRGAAYGGVYANNVPYGMGADNFNAMVCPTTITNTPQTIRMFYEVPITYSDRDLRGCIYLATTNATAQLQLTFNPTLVAASGAADATGAVYQSSTAAQAVPSNVKVTVYQEYLDQIPPQMIPILDAQMSYNLLTTTVSGLTVGNDFPIYYGNQREFYSTLLMYDNAGILNPGTDINYFTMVTANATAIKKIDPYALSMETRALIGDDTPPGTYYFDHRQMPIQTQQFGNMALNINPATVTSATASFVNVGWEFFTQLLTATTMASLQAG